MTKCCGVPLYFAVHCSSSCLVSMCWPHSESVIGCRLVQCACVRANNGVGDVNILLCVAHTVCANGWREGGGGGGGGSRNNRQGST